ncbi:MAG: LysE family translocator [Rhodocyclaceae bacterium]|nr:LysE family translocator [Rhodocyclaceae bacterium]
MSELDFFVAALVVVYLVPGPDMILILDTGARAGRSHALATAAGLALARATHVALAALGLATLFKLQPWTFELARLIGGAYLLYLAIRIAHQPAGHPAGTAGANDVSMQHAAIGHAPAVHRPLSEAFRRGLMTNLLNPKALLFCSVLLPQFVSADTTPVLLQFILLGSILVAVGLIFDVLYACTGQAIGRWTAGRTPLSTLRNYLFAGCLGGFGIKLLFAT